MMLSLQIFATWLLGSSSLNFNDGKSSTCDVRAIVKLIAWLMLPWIEQGALRLHQGCRASQMSAFLFLIWNLRRCLGWEVQIWCQCCVQQVQAVRVVVHYIRSATPETPFGFIDSHGFSE